MLWLFVATDCSPSIEKRKSKKKAPPARYFEADSMLKALAPNIRLFPVQIEAGKVQMNQQAEKNLFLAKNRNWVYDHVDKDFLLGRVKRENNPLFVKVDEKHTERNIYLIRPVYDAFKKMYEAALNDSVKLIITSGHRTFIEQIYEWELRWNNPRVDSVFADDVDKAKFVLQYRSMPGTSRHHWGTDIDLNSFNLDYFETKEGKKMYDWLQKNAATYGFYQSYTPIDEKRPTGYQEEKWHWSYKPLARLMLIEYLKMVTIHDIHGFEGDIAARKLPIITDWVSGVNPEMKKEDAAIIHNNILFFNN
jgi:LAS superfamily LD-carboxypeptidase LdcB